MRVISKEFNALVEHFGSLVPHTLGTFDYPSYEAMRAEWLLTGSIQVNTDHSDGTIFGHPRVNWLFRAWHDYCHLLVNAPFDAQGEKRAADEQIRQVYAHPSLSDADKPLFARIIGIEVNGQVDYYLAHNSFPPDQLAFFMAEWTRLYGEWEG